MRFSLYIIKVVLFSTNLFAQAPDTMWTKTYGGSGYDYGYAIQQTSDSCYVIMGSAQPNGDGPSDAWLIKTDINGDTLWTKNFGDSLIDEGYSIQQTTDGGFVITGIINLVPGNNGGSSQGDVSLIKTNSIGDTLWTKVFGNINCSDWGNSVQQTTDGGFFIVGVSCGYKGFCAGKYCGGSGDVLLIRTDVNGDTLWTKIYGDTSRDFGYSGKQTFDGGYIIAASKYDKINDTHNNGWLIKTDANGDTLWTKIFGDSLSDFFYSVQQTFDGGYIVAGSKGYDAWLIKADASGDTLWTKTFRVNEVNSGRFVQQTSDGGYIIVGSTDSISEDDSDILLIRTDANGNMLWTKTIGRSFNDHGYSVQRTIDAGYIITGSTQSFGPVSSDVWLIKVGRDITLIDENSNIFSRDYYLQQNYPNPFNPTTTIKFSISQSDFVTLKIYNILGKEVATLVSEKLNSGKYNYNWNAGNLASGIYIYILKSESFEQSRKMLLLR